MKPISLAYAYFQRKRRSVYTSIYGKPGLGTHPPRVMLGRGGVWVINVEAHACMHIVGRPTQQHTTLMSEKVVVWVKMSLALFVSFPPYHSSWACPWSSNRPKPSSRRPSPSCSDRKTTQKRVAIAHGFIKVVGQHPGPSGDLHIYYSRHWEGSLLHFSDLAAHPNDLPGTKRVRCEYKKHTPTVTTIS